MSDEPAGEHRRPLVQHVGVRGIVTLFGLTFLFYLAIGGFAGGLDLLTGAISAAVVSAALASVAFREEPTLRRTGSRLLRAVRFLPILLWEVLKANVVIAAVILHPRLPISPAVKTIETHTSEGFERMVLANSITLTPGSLVLDVQEREFVVHVLTAESLEGLEGGRLERLVSWVFHGGDER